MLQKSKNIICLVILAIQSVFGLAQSNPDDYWLNHPVSPFSSGQTITTNSGFFYDDGGDGQYNPGQDWTVRFCSENGNPITFDFNGFKTHYVGEIPGGNNYLNYDYLRVQYPGAGSGYVIYHDDTPQFGFTSPSGCIDFRFISQDTSLLHDGWIAEISALPPPANNDPCTAAALPVGNICSPSYFTNKGAYNTTDLGSPSCKTYFGGDVWFTAVVPPSGQLKIETFPGSLTYGIMALYTGACDSLAYVSCVDIVNSMPSTIYTGTSGTVVTIRIFGEQAKSGTFGICATDPTAPITGFTGPGGVGDSISNKLWLRADKGLLNNADEEALFGEQIKIWQDCSGKANDLIQPSFLSRGILTENAISTMPALQFEGTDDYYQGTMDPFLAPVNVFSVNRFLESKDQTLLTIGDATLTNSLSISREADDRYYSLTGSKVYGPTVPGTDPRILYASHKVLSPFHNLSINSVPQTGVENYAAEVNTNGSLYLGASANLQGFLNGQVGEVIVYTKSLNLAQEIIVHNYLAAKYDINIGANNRYSHASTHRHDVAGIGRVDTSNLHTRAQSAGILSVGGASDLEDNEFLLFGHNRDSIDKWLASGVPGGDENLRRLARTWRASISGTDGVGDISIILDDSLLPAFEPGFLAFNILVDADGDFSNGATAYGMIDNGDEFIANNVSLNDGDFIAIVSVKPFVGFTAAASSGLENIENPQIEVALNYAISEPFEVDYSITGGTASGGGVDFSLNPGKLIFNPGQRLQVIAPLIIDDEIVEIPDEYFTIGLSNPTAGVLLGDVSTHSYTILNNDIDISIFPANPVIGSCAASKDTLTATATGTGPFTYSWVPSVGLSNPGSSITEAKPSATTKYFLTVTDANDFTALDSVVVGVDPLPAKPTINPSGTVNLIYGDSITLSSSPALEYVWSTGDTNQSVIIKTYGSYSLKTRDIHGCESEGSDTTFVSSLDRQITVTADSGQSKVYSEADPVLTFTVTSGSLINGDSFTGTLTRVAGENVGTYAIQQGSLSAGPGYTITFVSNDFIINAKSLTVSNITANNKEYDGTTIASLTTGSYLLNGIIGAETVTLDTDIYTANFDTKDVGINKPVTVTGLVLAGADAGNYILTQPTGLTADITAKALSVSGITANDKEYDGTVTATLSTTGYALVGILGAETVVLDAGSYSASFDTKDVGSDKPITVTGLLISGVDAGNYTLTQPTGLTADITAKALSVSGITANDKEYDGTVTATLNTTGYLLNGIVGTEAVDLDAGNYTASFDTKDVGINKPVTVTGFLLTGAEAGNYTFTQLTGLTASITGKQISVSGIAANDKEYDGTTIATLTTGSYLLNGIIGAETVTLDTDIYTANFDTKDVGINKPVTLTGLVLAGADAGNYILTQPTGLTADITAKALSVPGITANDKEYDGTVTATLSTTGYALVGILGAETVVLDAGSYSASFDTKDVGTDKPVTVTGLVLSGADAGNYTLTQPTGLTASITAKALSVSGIIANDKEYDGTVIATLNTTGYLLNGIVGTEAVDLDAGNYTASFDTKDVGINKPVTVTGFVLTGSDAGNYTFAQLTGLTASITGKLVSVSGIAANDKEYDGTTIATLTTGSYLLNGIIGAETVTLDTDSYTANFDTKDAGINKPVTVTGLVLTGVDAGNYILTQPTGLTADITAKALSVSGITANDKEYDGTVTATLSTTGYVLVGILGAETVVLDAGSYSASFDTKDVGTDKPVTVTGLVLSGADVGNYTLTQPTGLTASITAKALSVSGITANDKEYDGTVTATLNTTGYLLNGIVGTEAVDLDAGNYTASFDTKDVGINKPVTVTGFVLTGAEAGNYTFTQLTGLTASITGKLVSVSGIAANDKEYDGTVTATLDMSAHVLTGILGAESVSLDILNYTANFDTKDVGINKLVIITSLSLNGVDAGNYILILPTGLNASITPKPLSVSGITANDKEYDGTVNAMLSTSGYTLIGILGTENVVLNAGSYSASFDTKNVGTGKPVTVTGLVLGGMDAGNYILTMPVLEADVTVRTLALFNFRANSKVYDGTTSVTGTGFDDDRVLGDILEFSYNAAFENPEMGVNKAVLYTNIAISAGTDKNNYMLATLSGTAYADIVQDIPAKPVISASGPLAFCAGGSVILTSTEAHSYLWSTGATTRSVTVSQTGSYTVIVANASGIQSSPSDVTAVTVYSNPVISLTKTDVLCFGGSDGAITSQVSQGTEPYTYAWNNGAVTQSVTNLPAGNYTLNVTDLNACIATAQVNISQPAQIVVQEVVSPALCPDSNDGEISITVSGGKAPFSFDWTGDYSGQDLTGLLQGNYSLTVTDANNCQVIRSITLPYLNEACFRIPSIITPNDDGFNDVWTIDGIHVYPEVTVEIYNRWGKRVFYSKGYEIKWDGTYDGKELPMDSYHYIINLKNGRAPIIGNVTIVR